MRHTPHQCHPTWHLLIIIHKSVFQAIACSPPPLFLLNTNIIDITPCWTPQHIRVDHDQKVGVEAAWVITDSSSHPTYILRLTGLFSCHSHTTEPGLNSSITVTLAGNPDVARVRPIRVLETLSQVKLGGILQHLDRENVIVGRKFVL